jgi:hypothetical protein
MENHSIHDLGLILDSELYVLTEERKQLIQKMAQEVSYGSDNSIIDVNIQEVAEEKTIPLEFEGGFEKGVLIVYEGQALSPLLSDLLFKILNAVGCSLKDIALFNNSQIEAVDLERIHSLGPEKVIVFGNLKHELMGYKRKNYDIQMNDGIEYLFVDELNAIHENKNLKVSLWSQLQALFNISKK